MRDFSQWNAYLSERFFRRALGTRTQAREAVLTNKTPVS